MVLKIGLPELIKLAKETGVAVLAITNSHHMAAMWPETEAIAEAGLVGFACTSYMPMVAPAGAKKLCLELIQFHLHGRVQEKHQLFMIWQQRLWLWEM